MIETTDWNHSLEAEQSILGAVMLHDHAIDQVADVLTETDFYTGEHRAIFRAAVGLSERGKPIDIVTVGERCKAEDAQRFERSGGQAYLAALTQATPGAAGLRRYAEIVRERALLRRLYGAAEDIRAAATNFRGRDVKLLLDEAQAAIMAIGAERAGPQDFQPATRVLSEAMAFVDSQHDRYAAGDANDVTGVPTGFIDLDHKTAGLHPGQLVILAARPGMGKSAFALNVSEAAARATGDWALFFTLEMGNREQGLRILASTANVNVQRLVSGRIYDHEWPRVTQAMSNLAGLRIAFNEQAALTVMELRSLARRALRDHGKLCMIVVDYVQLMLAGEQESNRATQLAEISRGLKLLAKELHVPVVALSQLNRELEKRTNKRPVMSDLRDSGALEQDADVILFIYRDEMYNAKTEDKGIAEIIIAKQRNGPIGVARLAFRAAHTRFENLAHGSGHSGNDE